MNTTTPMFIQSIKLSIDDNTIFERQGLEKHFHESQIYALACQVLVEHTEGKWSCLDRYPRPMYARGCSKTYFFKNSQGQDAAVQVEYIPAH